jgi:ATP-binding cassette, subfamily B, bacterial
MATLLRGAGAAGRLGELLAQSPTSRRRPSRRTAATPPGRWTFDDVTFRYPTRPDTSALTTSRLGAAGETARRGRPVGRRQVHHVPARPAFLRSPSMARSCLTASTCARPTRRTSAQRIAMVPQETVIFAASARDNLRYGNWNATDDRLWEAAEAANAADPSFARCPTGLDTFMGEGGARLSGGQRQRIAIARALLARRAAAAARRGDVGARRGKRAAGAGERSSGCSRPHHHGHRPPPGNRPRRRPDHRHGTQGRIVEEGTHDSLSARGGLYARLARLQFEGLAA